MARARRRAELTESWDDVDEDYNEGPIYTEDDERGEMRDSYQSGAATFDDERGEMRDSYPSGAAIFDDERGEMRDSYPSGAARIDDEQEVTRHRRGLRSSRDDDAPPRRRSARLSVEPELVLPPSPNVSGRGKERSTDLRASTPHFRLNERSMTSDAGKINVGPTAKLRASRPHSRMNQRSGRGKGRSPDLRASTPHFRLNERSMTSDAGKINGGPTAKLRASTPHSRINQRSITSDAGRLGLKLTDKLDDDEAEQEGDSVSSALWTRVLKPILTYSLDIVGLAFQNAKPLFGYALLLYVLIGAVMFCTNFVTNSVNNALTPICRIPGASWLNLPFCPASTPGIQGPAEFDKLVQAQSQFDDVLATAQMGFSLPLDMKRSEAGIRDLKHVVQYSSLPSRNELVFEFTGFVDTARQASQDLGKFNSRIGRAVDHILSTNRWTLSVIDGVGASEAGRGALTRWISDNLNIFAPFQPVSLSRDTLLDQYLRHTSAVEEQILTLISEAQALLNILDNLDGRLDLIASIAARDDAKAQGNREDLFAYLWTKLGGNRSSVAKLDQQIQLLKEVGQYRRLAWAHVTTTMVKLQAIRDNLEDLRERVAMPETVGARVPLEVHIDSINLGIERLEQQRDASRRVEAESYSRVLSRAEEGDRRMIGEKEM